MKTFESKIRALRAIDYEVAPDPDQPGMWFWVNNFGEACELSFATQEEAVDDAMRYAAMDEASDGDQPWFAGLVPGDEVWWNDPDNGIASGYYHIVAVKLADDDAPIGPGTVVDLQNDCGTEVEAFVSELSPSRPTETARLRLVLDVTYDLNGEDTNIMKRRLYRAVEYAIGEGLLTGSTSAEVDEYSMDVAEFPEVDEDALIDFFVQQIEDGLVRPETVARKFVQYGLMEPPEFAFEMQERMEMAKEEGDK